jgi:hypothetical protein
MNPVRPSKNRNAQPGLFAFTESPSSECDAERTLVRDALRLTGPASRDSAFEFAHDFFRRELDCRGAALSSWLELAGVPTKCREDAAEPYAIRQPLTIPNYAIWPSTRIMVESMAEIYYRELRTRDVNCIIAISCERLLRDEVARIRLECDRRAAAQIKVPASLRRGMIFGERLFYGAVGFSVYIAHGRLLRVSCDSWHAFLVATASRFRMIDREANRPTRRD